MTYQCPWWRLLYWLHQRLLRVEEDEGWCTFAEQKTSTDHILFGWWTMSFPSGHAVCTVFRLEHCSLLNTDTCQYSTHRTLPYNYHVRASAAFIIQRTLSQWRSYGVKKYKKQQCMPVKHKLGQVHVFTHCKLRPCPCKDKNVIFSKTAVYFK